MEDIFLPFKKGGMNDIDLGEATASQPESSSQDQGDSSSMEVDSTSTQVMCTCYVSLVHLRVTLMFSREFYFLLLSSIVKAS